MPLAENQLKAIEMLTSGHDMELKDIAEACGVTDRTLRNWRNDPEFNAELAQKAGDLVDGILYKEAMTGDIRAIQTYYQRFGKLKANEEDPIEAMFNVEESHIKEIEMDIYLAVKERLGK